MTKRFLLAAALTVMLLVTTAPAVETPTFSNEVVRILQARCQTCHRPDEHAPFPLLAYRDAYQRRDDIRDAVRGREMPPWKPVPGFGDFLEPRRLSDAELTTLVRWIEAGELHVRAAGALAGRDPDRHGGGVRQLRRESSPAEPSSPAGELGRGHDRRDGDRLRRRDGGRGAHRLAPQVIARDPRAMVETRSRVQIS
jgi:mono/diheme cytochrome c family protein